jgi:hypothetical protein
MEKPEFESPLAILGWQANRQQKIFPAPDREPPMKIFPLWLRLQLWSGAPLPPFAKTCEV